MTILVTGAGGRIGSSLARTLIERGEQVVGFDVAPPPPHSVLYPLLGSFPFVPGTILDLPVMLHTIKQHRVTDILHLAALMGARDRPLEMVRTNIEGTLNILEAGRIMGLRRVICTSSFGAAAAYGKDPMRPIPETEYSLPVLARDITPPYGATKLMCEELTYMYRHDYNVDAAIIRPAMVFGPALPPGRMGGHPIEFLLGKAVKGEPFKAAQGRASYIDLAYIKDTVEGYVLAYKAPKLPNWLYNISGGKVYSVGQIADAVTRHVPGASIQIGEGPWRDGDLSTGFERLFRPAPDISRARQDLGFAPRFGLDEGIADYLQWIKHGRF